MFLPTRVVQGDETVGVRGKPARRTRIERALDRPIERTFDGAGDCDMSVRRYRKAEAGGGRRRPKGTREDQLADGIIFQQRHVLGAANCLAGGGAGHVGQHIDRPVGSDLGRAYRLDLRSQRVGEHPAVDEVRLARNLRRRVDQGRVGLELQQLGLGPPIGGLGIVIGIGIADALGDIDRARRRRRREGHRLAGADRDLQRPLVSAGRQCDGLAAALERARLAGNALRREAGFNPGRRQLAVHIGNDVAERARLSAHRR